MQYTPPGVADPESVQSQQLAGTAATLPPVANFQGSLWLLNGNCTFTMPPVQKGAFCYVIITQAAGGGDTVSFTGVKWPGGTAPTMSSGAGAIDRYDFVSDGVNWYGITTGQAFA